MIEINNLVRRYGDFTAVDDVSFSIKQGEIVGLLGHNGAGKTTIMKMMTGYLEPTAGEINIDNLTIGKDTRAIQSRIGYLPENCPVWPEMTVIDYLDYQASLHNLPESKRSRAIASAIRRTALKEKATQSIQTLSRGYRQRVGVAQAILHNPDIVILDEPTNGLDPTQILHMRDLIQELAKTATVIISTHILQEVQAVCERVLIMRTGKLVIDSRIDALQEEQRLWVTVDSNLGKQFNKVKGVANAELQEKTGKRFTYALKASAEKAPEIAQVVQKAGAKLYSLHPEQRSLESVFAEVNVVDKNSDKSAAKEVKHA